MIVGFTGTQRGLTFAQRTALLEEFRMLGPASLRHGDCAGADDEAHTVYRSIFPMRTVIVHPPIDTTKAVGRKGRNVERLAPRPYLERNHDIVDGSDAMIACPGEENEKLRSGTWATIRYALKANKPITIFFPSGDIRRHNWRY